MLRGFEVVVSVGWCDTVIVAYCYFPSAMYHLGQRTGLSEQALPSEHAGMGSLSSVLCS